MDKQQLPELRVTLLEIMDAIHELCVREKIRYYIIGGTALGAIRHGGFIPWDTDIDIAMPRSDYDKFFEICDKCIRTGFGSISYHNEDKFYLPHALVVKKASLIHWNSSYYKKNKIDIPVYVDVFPLDEAPNNEEDRVKQEKAIRKKMRLQSRRNCIIYQRNTLVQQIMKSFVALLLSVQSNKKFNEQLDALMAKYSDGTHRTWCSMASHYSYKKQCMDSDIYGKPKLYNFEDKQYFGPEQIEKYLTHLFGDYMTPPPVEQQSEYMDYIGYIDF